MRLAPLVALSAVALAACSTLSAHDVPGCHGPRRPANPHGSVLAPAASPAAPPPAGGSAGGCGRPRP